MHLHVVSNTIRLNHMASNHASCFNTQAWVVVTQSRQTVWVQFTCEFCHFRLFNHYFY
ncbi:unnamed protein product [Meloidogyne enterolobii]|uniref:Uncharacterized protein n=1 Tax=Meloidogyne enterolobii TaxID=390850 RepID=A0ACB0YCN3_MELEN